jgi:hypothetical protein
MGPDIIADVSGTSLVHSGACIALSRDIVRVRMTRVMCTIGTMIPWIITETKTTKNITGKNMFSFSGNIWFASPMYLED